MSSPASGPLTCYIPPPPPVEQQQKTFHHHLVSFNMEPASAGASGPDLVFGRRVVQRVQLPAQFVQLIVDVVHLGAQPLVLPKVGVKLSLVFVSLGIGRYLGVNAGGRRGQEIILDSLHTPPNTYGPPECVNPSAASTSQGRLDQSGP